MQFAGRAAFSAHAVSGLGVLLLLAGCTTGMSNDQPSPNAPSHTSPPVDSGVTDSVVPTIVVSNMDVDGANATVSGYVAGILESGGKCTFTVSRDGAESTVESTAEADRSTTSCGALQVPGTELVKGEWSVVLVYTALNGTEFTSAPATLVVP